MNTLCGCKVELIVWLGKGDLARIECQGMLLISPFILGVVLLRQYLLYELIVSCLPILADDKLEPPS